MTSSTKKRPHIQLSRRAIAAPLQFTPTQTWIEQGYIYRYDPKRQICKRSPVTSTASAGTAFFKVELLAPEIPRPANVRPILPADAATRKQVADRIHRSLRTGRLVVSRAILGSVAAVAAFVMVYPYVPEIQYRLYKSTPAASADIVASEPTVVTAESRLVIPAIGVNTKILEGDSLSILDKEEGVWHQTGAFKTGNTVLAGHRFRYMPPNNSTFYNLNKLTEGDTITIDRDGKRVMYEVKQVRVVLASEVSILQPTERPRLTLYTCDDVHETRRIVVVAEPL